MKHRLDRPDESDQHKSKTLARKSNILSAMVQENAAPDAPTCAAFEPRRVPCQKRTDSEQRNDRHRRSRTRSSPTFHQRKSRTNTAGSEQVTDLLKQSADEEHQSQRIRTPCERRGRSFSSAGRLAPPSRETAKRPADKTTRTEDSCARSPKRPTRRATGCNPNRAAANHAPGIARRRRINQTPTALAACNASSPNGNRQD